MKNPKSIVTLAVVLLIALFAVWTLVSNNNSNTTQTGTNTVGEVNLNSELNSLDSTDLDTGTNAQLEQLSSDSSSF